MESVKKLLRSTVVLSKPPIVTSSSAWSSGGSMEISSLINRTRTTSPHTLYKVSIARVTTVKIWRPSVSTSLIPSEWELDCQLKFNCGKTRFDPLKPSERLSNIYYVVFTCLRGCQQRSRSFMAVLRRKQKIAEKVLYCPVVVHSRAHFGLYINVNLEYPVNHRSKFSFVAIY